MRADLLEVGMDTDDQQARDRKGGSVEHERDVPAECRGDQAADGRAHREHHSPGRADQHVRLAQLVLLDEIGECRGRRGLEERRADGQQEHSEQRDPEGARVAREQERQRHRDAREVGGDEQLPSIEPIGEDAGERRRKRESARLEDEHQRRGRG